MWLTAPSSLKWVACLLLGFKKNVDSKNMDRGEAIYKTKHPNTYFTKSNPKQTPQGKAFALKAIFVRPKNTWSSYNFHMQRYIPLQPCRKHGLDKPCEYTRTMLQFPTSHFSEVATPNLHAQLKRSVMTCDLWCGVCGESSEATEGSHSDNVWREVPNSIHHYASASTTAGGNEHRPHETSTLLYTTTWNRDVFT